jgi:hypothetical protein
MGSLRPLGCCTVQPLIRTVSSLGEADTIIGKRSDARYPVAGILWAVAGVVLLLALGDVVIVLALALAAAAEATAWWLHHYAGHCARNCDVALASVFHLRAGHREPKQAFAYTLWHRHNAA